MATTAVSFWEVFKACLQFEGMFFFLPQATCDALEAGERNIVVFHNQEPEWREHYLHDKLTQIQLGVSPLFRPAITDPEAWEVIRSRIAGALSLEPHREGRSGHLALDDGSVVEFLWCKVRVGKRRESPLPAAYRQEDEGYLVAVRQRYLRSAVNEMRRILEQLLREGDRAHVIRFAKLAGIHIPGEAPPPHPQEGSAT